MLDSLMPNHMFAIILIFAGSLYALMRGADWLIEGSSSLAKRLNISDLVVGLTVVAFGTSLPELVVSVQAALAGSSALAYANVIGSNTANTLLVLGMASIVTPIVTTDAVRKDLKFYALLILGFCALIYYGNKGISSIFFFESSLGLFGGVCLLAYFSFFIIRILLSEKSALVNEAGDSSESTSLGKAILLVVVGLILTIVGGEVTVQSAIKIATRIGVSETTIGLTIVAIGTSLPELVASLSMASKGKPEMIVGNVLGSNVMNLSLVLGTAAVISEVPIDTMESFDMVFHTVVGLIFLIFMLRPAKTFHLNRRIGSLFVLIYLAYMAFVGLR